MTRSESGFFGDPTFVDHVKGLEGVVAAHYPRDLGHVTLVGVSGRTNRTTNFAAMGDERVTSVFTQREAGSIRLANGASEKIGEASRVVLVDEAGTAPQETLAVAEQVLGQEGVEQVDLVLTSRLSDQFTVDVVTGLDMTAIREALGRTN